MHIPEQDTHATIHRRLMADLIDAITEDPSRAIPTPGFNDRRMSATEVVEDLLAGKGSEVDSHALMQILGRCASGRLDQQTHLMASALLATLARQHADFHADECDFVREAA